MKLDCFYSKQIGMILHSIPLIIWLSSTGIAKIKPPGSGNSRNQITMNEYSLCHKSPQRYENQSK